MLRQSFRLSRVRPSHATAIHHFRQRCRTGLRHYIAVTGSIAPVASQGIISTRDLQATSIEQLLKQLAQAKFFSRPFAHGRPTSLLALFLTPGYAQHALDPDLPLRALEILLGKSDHVKELRTIVAVVDRVPELDIKPTRKGRSKGLEGVAYSFIGGLLEDEETILSLNQPRDQSTASSKQFAHIQPGALGFVVNSWYRGAQSHKKIELPLAQTVFSTGRTSTLVSSVFRRDGTSAKLVANAQPQALESQTLPLAFPSWNHRIRPHLPLLPLTSPKEVRNCMGNIVRTLSSQPTDFGSQARVDVEQQPASTELESVISGLFESEQIPPQAVQIWALVLPRALTDSEALRTLTQDALSRSPGTGDFRTQETQLSTAKSMQRLLLHYGARLCRVLSGGGGWGKKAGLLSLDPEVAYSTSADRTLGEARDLESVEEYVEQDEQRRSALGEIVKEGEHVMFFLGPPASITNDDQEHLDRMFMANDRVPEHKWNGAVFGCNPSTIDEGGLPNAAEETSVSLLPSISHNTIDFGVLSEGGMAIATMPNLKETADDRHDLAWQTRVNIPHARIWVLPPSEKKNSNPNGPPGRAAYKDSAIKPRWVETDPAPAVSQFGQALGARPMNKASPQAPNLVRKRVEERRETRGRFGRRQFSTCASRRIDETILLAEDYRTSHEE